MRFHTRSGEKNDLGTPGQLQQSAPVRQRKCFLMFRLIIDQLSLCPPAASSGQHRLPTAGAGGPGGPMGWEGHPISHPLSVYVGGKPRHTVRVTNGSFHTGMAGPPGHWSSPHPTPQNLTTAGSVAEPKAHQARRRGVTASAWALEAVASQPTYPEMLRCSPRLGLGVVTVAGDLCLEINRINQTIEQNAFFLFFYSYFIVKYNIQECASILSARYKE